MPGIVKLVFILMVAALSFLANPYGPLGAFWPPAVHTPERSLLQVPFFTLLTVLEAVSFAAALVFTLTDFPRKPFRGLTIRETRLGFVTLMALLGNWWIHDSLHIHVGNDVGGLLLVEYGFHVTMMIATGYLMYLLNKSMRATHL